jgi:hypothetical protein
VPEGSDELLAAAAEKNKAKPNEIIARRACLRRVLYRHSLADRALARAGWHRGFCAANCRGDAWSHVATGALHAGVRGWTWCTGYLFHVPVMVDTAYWAGCMGRTRYTADNLLDHTFAGAYLRPETRAGWEGPLSSLTAGRRTALLWGAQLLTLDTTTPVRMRAAQQLLSRQQ